MAKAPASKAAPKASAAPKTASNLTGNGTHRATERGYAAGQLIEPGEAVPPGVVKGSWMERADGKKEALDRAVQEALDPLPKDPDYTQLDTAALQALAIENGVQSVEGLSDEDLITAIKAAHDPKR